MTETLTQILLVEDDEAHIDLIRRAFEEGPDPVALSVARSLREAGRRLAETVPHLVITDLLLPDGKGTELVPADRDESVYPVVVMTSHGNERMAVEAIKAGALDYIVKSEAVLLDMPHIARRSLREWGHIVEHRRAAAEIRRRNRELSLLNRIISASANNSEEEILDKTCREVGPAFNVPRTRITLLDPRYNSATVVAEYVVAGQPVALHSSLPLMNHPVLQYLLTQKAPLVTRNIDYEPHLEALREFLRWRGVVALLSLPLINAGKVIGSLDLEVDKPRSFSTDEINLAWSVTDQVAMALDRARLDQERRQLTAVIEQTAESIVITDTCGTILYVNPAFERITGYSRTEILGQNPRLLKSNKHSPEFYREMWETLNAGKVWRGRLINKKKDGSLYTEEETITPVRAEDGTIVYYVAVKHDVTRELQLEAQYYQAQKMEAVGRLTAGITHDFNNLLTVINGFATLLQGELPPGAPPLLREASDKILQSGLRAASLTRQLLAFSRQQIVEPRPVHLNSLVTEMDKMLRRIIGDDIELQLNLTPDLWTTKIDPIQLDQIIMNLAVNARDAMPLGGQLTIETANVTLKQDDAGQYAEVTPGDYVMLVVSDTGVGMSDEVKQHLFEPFFTTKELGKGTGLGLATIFGIVKQNGGHLWVYSEVGHGTFFKIYLPRLVEAAVPAYPPPQVRELPRGVETILLVENEPGVRDLAARVLRRQGYVVLEAASGPEALRLAEAHAGSIDLLLTDVIMPQMSGRTLAGKVAEFSAGARVLYTSGYTDHAVLQQGLLSGPIMFLQKPFSPASLVNKVRETLDYNPPSGQAA